MMLRDGEQGSGYLAKYLAKCAAIQAEELKIAEQLGALENIGAGACGRCRGTHRPRRPRHHRRRAAA